MAEAIVQTVIGKAVEMAADQLFQMGSSLHHLQDNIETLERQMRTLQSYLKDAEFKKAKNNQVAQLIREIRDLAQDAEDTLDTYLPEFERHRTKGPFHFVKHACCILCYGATARSFELEIEKIKERAAKVENSMDTCGVAKDANAGANDDMEVWESRKLFLKTRDSKVFGREETLQELEKEMLTKDEECKIISVVGQGGIGKTTVAKKVYMEAKDKFDCCAMVYVSNKPKVEELLRHIARQVGLSEDKIKENLGDNLRLFLQERAYLIYLDDIWEQQPWDPLRNVLVTNSEKGSRILITSRNIEVCQYIGSRTKSTLVPLNLLSVDEGKEFFNNLRLPTTERAPLPPVLKAVGVEIVGKCGGLPLAIEVAVGLLLAKRQEVNDWKRVRDSIMAEGDEKKRFQEILALSYEDLPTDIKPLFIYFGIFPEDYEIFVRDLIPLWVAEKLITIDGSRRPHQIVEDKIEYLIARNLIQVSKRGVDGRIRSCRIHDLLHNLCVRVSKECNFFCTWDNLQSSGLASIVRRVTSNSNSSSEDYNFQKQLEVPTKLRSLIEISENKQILMFIKTNASVLKFLRFLIVELHGDRGEVTLPNEIGNLSSLICLRLSGVFKKIPSSVGHLKKLETLEVKILTFQEVGFPAIILRMKHLKHLILRNVSLCFEESIVDSCFPRKYPSKKSVCCFSGEIEVDLPSLETAIFGLVVRLPLIEKSLKKLSNLKKLSVDIWETSPIEIISGGASILKMETLKLYLFLTDVSRLNLSRYQNLLKLHLFFSTSYPAADVDFPPNLVKISLTHANIHDDCMETLKRLKKLEALKLELCDGRAGRLDFCGENSFPQLQFLIIYWAYSDELIVDEVGMPKLHKFIYVPRFGSESPDIPERLKKLLAHQY